MSYDIYLVDPITRECLTIDRKHNFKGGTYQEGGTNKLWLNITYNYARFYYRAMGEQGIRSIYGLTGKDSIPILKNAIECLKDDFDIDYWKPCEGNAKRALHHLLIMALRRPDGIWYGD